MMSVHAKMSLTHSIVQTMCKHVNSKTQNIALAPALVETYCRLLVFSEIESLGIKGKTITENWDNKTPSVGTILAHKISTQSDN